VKKEVLKVVGIDLTFFTRCLKKLAWHKRCSGTRRALPRSRRAFLTIAIFVPLMKFPGPCLTLTNAQLGGVAAARGCAAVARSSSSPSLDAKSGAVREGFLLCGLTEVFLSFILLSLWKTSAVSHSPLKHVGVRGEGGSVTCVL